MTYDASQKKLLKKCTVTFMHDEYEIVRVRYDFEYGAPIRQLDVSHPSLTAVQLVYVWDSSVQVDDTALGIVVLFACTVVFLFLLCFVTANSEDPQPPQQAAHITIGGHHGHAAYAPGAKSVRFNNSD